MKIDYNLTRNLRRLFELARAAVLLLVPIVAVKEFVQPWEYRWLNFPEPPSNHRIAEVALTFKPGVYQLTMAKGMAGDVALTNVRGTLEMNGTSTNAELTALVRWDLVLRLAVGLAVCFLLCDLLCKLCGNVERGEIFSEKNTRLVRNLGFVIIGAQVLGFAVGTWYAHLIGIFLEQKIVAEGVRLQIYQKGPMFSLNISMVVTGCLVLALSEVFRQGLALKKENELTV
jgi:Protein of unknown function (DUF2975)